MANPFNMPMVGRTLRNLVSRPATRRYPMEVREPCAGARGTLEFDLDSCVFCGLCAKRCPAVAITCIREEKFFAIEQLTCIACGVCVDVCNKHSLSLSVVRRAVHASADEPGPGRPGHEEWRKPEPPAPIPQPVATTQPAPTTTVEAVTQA
jgi:ech hydrogenase subunit F